MHKSLLVGRRRSPAQSCAADGAVLVTMMCWCLTFLAACGGNTNVGGGNGGGGGSTMPVAATVTFCDSPASTCVPAASFSVSSLRDLSVAVAWANVKPGLHAQKLTFLLPNGNVYQVFETSLSVPAAGSVKATQSIPVAGTFISQRSLTGTWKVDVSLDDQLVTSQSLGLNP